jgi:hypothetical protein
MTNKWEWANKERLVRARTVLQGANKQATIFSEEDVHAAVEYLCLEFSTGLCQRTSCGGLSPLHRYKLTLDLADVSARELTLTKRAFVIKSIHAGKTFGEPPHTWRQRP